MKWRVGRRAPDDSPTAGQSCDRRPRMDRRLAQRNLTAGLVAAGLALFLFGLTFFVAVIYTT